MKNYTLSIVFLILLSSYLNCQTNTDKEPEKQEIVLKEGWNTYVDSFYAFKISYPPRITHFYFEGAMSEKERQERINYRTLSYWHKYLVRRVSFGNRVVPEFWISVHKIPEALELKEFAYNFIDNKLVDMSKIEWTNKTINMLPCLIADFKSVAGPGGPARDVFYKKKDLVFVLFVRRQSDYEDIINSFRF